MTWNPVAKEFCEDCGPLQCCDGLTGDEDRVEFVLRNWSIQQRDHGPVAGGGQGGE